MLKQKDLFAMIYSSLASSLSLAIYLLGEKRIDAYLAINILIYYITYLVSRPLPREPIHVRMLNTALVIIFIAIVSWRVYEVLSR